MLEIIAWAGNNILTAVLVAVVSLTVVVIAFKHHEG